MTVEERREVHVNRREINVARWTEPDTKWVHRRLILPREIVSWLLRMVWEGVKRAGGEWRRLCVIRPRGGAIRVGERAAVCSVTMYVHDRIVWGIEF